MTIRIKTWNELTSDRETSDQPCTVENYHNVKSMYIENQTWCNNGIWIVLIYGKNDKLYIGFDEEHDEIEAIED